MQEKVGRYGVYSAWKVGRSRNFCEHLGEISHFLGVNAEYMATGSVSEKMVETEREQELLEWYLKLSAEKCLGMRKQRKSCPAEKTVSLANIL